MIGQNLGGYQILRTLRRSRYSESWLARHNQTGDEYILNTVVEKLSENADFCKQFQQELNALVGQEHDHLVKIEQVFHDQRLVVVCEKVEGETLSDILGNRGMLKRREIFNYLKGILKGLEFAHLRGVRHRDLSADHILIDRRGVAMVDHWGAGLGICYEYLLADVTLVEGLHYASPERFVDPDKVDAASDLYGVGVILFKMLTGCFPFSATSNLEMEKMHRYEPVPDIYGLNKDAEKPLVNIANKALEKDVKKRFGQASEMLRAIEDPSGFSASESGHGGSTAAATATGGFFSWLSWRKVFVGLVLGVIASLIGNYIWEDRPEGVFIKDDVLRQHLLSSVDTNDDGIISEKEAGVVTEIILPDALNGRIETLEGLEAFHGLKKLHIDDQNYRSLPLLPDTLLELNCSSAKLVTLPRLPRGLQVLKCANNGLPTLPELPKGLKELSCGKNALTSIGPLPDSLEHISAVHNKLTDPPVLSRKSILKYLDLSYNNFTQEDCPALKNLKDRLGSGFLYEPQNAGISCGSGMETVVVQPPTEQPKTPTEQPKTPIDPVFIQFPDVIFHAWVLRHYDANNDGGIEAQEISRVTALELEASLGISRLDGIEAFSSLERLTLEDSRLRFIPTLPASLRHLNLKGNSISQLPPLPAGLIEVRLSHNSLKNIDSLLGLVDLKKLWVDHNRLVNTSCDTIRALELKALDVFDYGDQSPVLDCFASAQRRRVSIRGVNLTFVKVPEEAFLLYHELDNTERSHSVVLTESYWLSRREVTEELWYTVMGGTARNPNLPVTGISYRDIQTFIGRVSNDGVQVALPTEAQWYRAALGEEPGATEISSRQMGSASSRNPLGIENLLDNVAEMSCEPYHPHPEENSVETNPRYEQSNRFMLVLGGHYASANYRFSRRRDSVGRNDREQHIGFRLVLLNAN